MSDGLRVEVVPLLAPFTENKQVPPTQPNVDRVVFGLVAIVRLTPIWQLVTLPAEPVYCL
jgi:hypothetical protein